MSNLIPVILAGGSGTRLWPLSRRNFPKQLTALISEKSLLQETYERLTKQYKAEDIYVCLGPTHLAKTQAQLPKIPKKNFIVEPAARNTAPAIALIAKTIHERSPHAIVATLASDHLVENTDEFLAVLEASAKIITRHPNYFMTIGLTPTEANTGLGYIEMGEKYDQQGSFSAFKVDQFHEKPSQETATKYIKSMRFLWNANYLVWRADHMLNLYKQHQPKIFEAVALAEDKKQRETFVKKYSALPGEPVDTAINEKEQNILVIPVQLGWNDIGSWSTLHDVLAKRSGHHIVKRGEHIGIDDKNILVYSKRHLVATVGLEDMIIVSTPDVTLVLNKNRAQDVKMILDELKKQGKEIYL